MKSTRNSGRHPFKILSYNGRKVWIDEDIAPLLSNMWKLGIRTWNSCQGMCSFKCAHKVKIKKLKNGITNYTNIRTKECGKFVWLVFDRAEDLELFYNLVAEPKDFDNEKSMYGQVESPNIWSIKYPMRNHGISGHWGRPNWGGKRSTQMMWIDDGCKKNNFIMSPQLTFPREHLSYVEERIELALSKLKKKEKSK